MILKFFFYCSINIIKTLCEILLEQKFKSPKFRTDMPTFLRSSPKSTFPAEFSLMRSGKPVSGTGRLASLSPELDSVTGLIRVGGRLRHCDVG